MRFLFSFFFFFIGISFLFAQNKPSSHEITWGLFHPFVVLKAKKITALTVVIVEDCKLSKCLDNYSYAGQVDAFRHAMWMALLSQKINSRKALKLGVAHEKKNKTQFKKGKYSDDAVPDYASIRMDLLNNKIGADIGKLNKLMSTEELKNLIIKKIVAGDFYIIKRSSKGNFIDSLGTEISIEEQKTSWKNKKYLVKSNQ